MIFAETFVTARLCLRPIRTEDAAAIFDAYAQDAEVSRYLSWRPHVSLGETQDYVAAVTGRRDQRVYVLTSREDGAVIGSFDLRHPAPGRLSFGYVLARAQWGRGLMTEGLDKVAGWALTQPGIWRIGSCADIDNRASMRVMEKAGLHREGVLRRWAIQPNLGPAPRDFVAFAKVRD